jgi:uncharacterized membrane protein
MTLLVLVLAVVTAPYFTLNPQAFFEQQRAVYQLHTFGIIGHIAGSMVALVVGVAQLLPQLRRPRYLRFHRWLGRIYLVAVLVGSLFGFYMAWFSFGGLTTHISFATLATWWFITGLVAYRHIRAGDVRAHRRWMIRNYAMTFAAVTLRLWLVLLIVLQVPFEQAYQTVAWIAWVWNIPVAEWIIRRVEAPHRPALQPVPSVA